MMHMPAPQTATTPPALAFRPLLDADIPEVSALAHAIWNHYYPPLIGQEQTDYMNALFNTEKSIRAQIHEQGYRYMLALDGDRIAGYAAVRQEKPGEWYISKFYVDTALHRRGIGSALMRHLIAECEPRSLSLHVNERNWKSINFYFRHGFIIADTLATDIGNGFVMEDFVMIRYPA
jgi:ribosomal protein S18 acetylase RimI-like enzyme